MKKLILSLLSLLTFVGVASCQQPSPVTTLAKCIIPFTINSTSTTSATGKFQPSQTGYDNRQTGCTNWSLVYTSTGYTVISLRFESAQTLSNTPPGTPNTYGAFSGTLVTGVNPSVSTTSTSASFSGYAPWIRIAANTLTGTGRIVGVLIGTLPISATGGSAGTPCPSPCPVDGPTAAGIAPTTPPVLIAGQDDPVTGVIRTILTDNFGRILNLPVANSGTIGSGVISDTIDTPLNDQGGVTIQQIFPYLFNGTNWSPSINCPNQALFNLSGSGNTQIIALSGSTTIRICHISLSTTAAEDIKITRGTGSNCGTGTTDVTGLYKSVQSIALDFGPMSPLKGAASGAICVNQSAAQATGGIVTYAQF